MRPVVAPRRRSAWASVYDLVVPSVGVGVMGGLLFNSLAVGLITSAIVMAASSVWRHGEAPVLSFALAYQWMFIAVPVCFFAAYGRGPLYNPVGDLETAAGLSMVGFLCLAAGIRAGAWVFNLERYTRRLKRRDTSWDLYDPRRLCMLVVAVNAVDWVFEIRPALLFFVVAQFIEAALAFRDVLLLALFYAVLRRGSGYKYAIVGLISAIVPRFASVQSGFKELLFMIVVAMLAEWARMRSGGRFRQARARMLLGSVAAGTVGLLLAGIVWEGAIKPVWRVAATGGTPMEKVAAFYRTASSQASMMDLSVASERLAARLSTGVLFGYVLERVPRVVPHTEGDLLMGAVRHVTEPRFLFPDKPNLGSGSERAELYAGLTVGGGTSVSIGYMAEFYVDFGAPGMFAPMILFGALVGAIYALTARFAPSRTFFDGAVTVLIINTFLTFEGNFTKIIGGMLVSAFVFIVLLALLGPRLHRTLVSAVPNGSRAQPPTASRALIQPARFTSE